MKKGDILIANFYCGFPDMTTKGKKYKVTKVNEFGNFYIINDEFKEIMPISTVFKKFDN